MGLSSLHVCMDSSDDWLQGTINEEAGIMDSSSSPSSGVEMLTRSRPMIAERRLRPPHDQSLKCPRCDSTHTKFCYYNNYSLSQPRYFCKTCRRYWTNGGTLRNIPVGGGCRKNKKVSSKKSNNNSSNNHPLAANTNSNQQNHHQLQHNAGSSNYHHNHHHNTKDLHLSFPDVQFNSHLSNILGNNNNNSHSSNFMESKYGIGAIGMLENPIRPIDFIMESKLEGMIGNSSRNFDFFGNGGEMGMANVGLGDHINMNNNGHHHHNHHGTNFHGLCSTPHHASSFGGMSLDGSNNGGNYMMDSSSSSSYQRLMLPYDAGSNEEHNNNAAIDVKPNPKLLSLGWQQEQGCSDAGKESFGYGSWSGIMNAYGSSTTNPLV